MLLWCEIRYRNKEQEQEQKKVRGEIALIDSER